MDFIFQPQNADNVGDTLNRLLSLESSPYSSFYASVAFAKLSGVALIQTSLSGFIGRGNDVKIIVGIDHDGTSVDALSALLEACPVVGQLWVNHCSDSFVTFHPKLYMFDGTVEALIIIGSNNLTRGGLFTNDECAVVITLKYSIEADANTIEKIKNAFRQWSDETTGNSKALTTELLDSLIEQEYIFNEEQLKLARRKEHVALKGNRPTTRRTSRDIFKRSAVSRKLVPTVDARDEVIVTPQVLEEVERTLGFVMTLQRTDVGSGQTTVGTSRRSPEIFIPLAARDAAPDFWGWQDLFTEDGAKPGKYDRGGVRMRIGGNDVSVNMMTWPVKHDFRLRSEALRSAGNIGDILRMELAPEGSSFDYYVEIIPQGTSDFDTYYELCVEKTRNSNKEWGYYSA